VTGPGNLGEGEIGHKSEELYQSFCVDLLAGKGTEGK
jgi:hypothetical protein